MKKPTIYNPNGQAATTLSPAQQECIDLLEMALESARKGDMNACVLVAVGEGDFGVAMAGSDAPKLYMGCAVAQRTILERTSPSIGGGRTVLHR